MNYYKYKHITIGEFGDPARVTHSLNLPHAINDESEQAVVQDYIAKDRFNDFSVCAVSGTSEQIKAFVSSQSEHIGLTKINKSEFTPLKEASYSYARDLEILAEIKQAKLNEIKLAKETLLIDSELNVDGVGIVDAGRNHLQNVGALIKLCEATSKNEVDFRLRDNTSTKISLEQLKLIELKMSEAAASIYAKCWSLCEQINSASDFASVVAIKWDSDAA